MATSPEQATLAPRHVPDELVRDIDIYQYARELDDPFLAGSRLHEGPDIFWATTAANGHPGWVLTRFDHLQEAYLDTDHFSSERADLAAMGVSWKLNPLEFDPPEHHRYRRILTPLFTPAAIAAMDEPVKNVCDSLIADFADAGRCEFISQFAEKFPSYVFLDLMGMPRDLLPQFLEWEGQMLHADPAGKARAMLSVFGYLETFVAEQRQHSTTELMRTIVSADYEGERPLSGEEVMGMVALLYIAGLDTVISTLGWVMHHLANDQALQAQLRQDPALIPQAVDEFVRAYPVAQPHRKIKKDLDFHGIEMRKGDHVLMSTFLAHRDPQAFPDPHSVDINRKPRHLAFATGPHVCLGMHLAKRELRTVIEAFVTRLPGIRMQAGSHYTYHTGGTFGVDSLPLEWD